MPLWQRVTYWAGEPVHVGLAVAHGGGEPLREVDAALALRQRGRGRRGPSSWSTACASCRPVSFPAPPLETAAVARLELELVSAGQVVATNHLELTILPRRDADARRGHSGLGGG